MAAKKSSGGWKWIIILLLVGGAFAGWRWYASKPEGAAPDYKTISVAKGDITQIVTANGQISGDEDTLRLVTSEFRAIINCVKRGDHDIFTIMIVAGNNDAQTLAIMEEIRTGMRGGIKD